MWQRLRTLYLETIPLWNIHIRTYTQIGVHKTTYTYASFFANRTVRRLSVSAVKDLGAKAGGILEEQKKKLEEQLLEKRNAVGSVIEQQVRHKWLKLC